MSDATAPKMPIWAWIAAAFAAAFLVNAVPHSVMGLTGQAFPTPFSGGPPNNSDAITNVIWGAINLAIGLGLLRLIRPWKGRLAIQIVMAVVGLAFALMLAWAFTPGTMAAAPAPTV